MLQEAAWSVAFFGGSLVMLAGGRFHAALQVSHVLSWCWWPPSCCLAGVRCSLMMLNGGRFRAALQVSDFHSWCLLVAVFVLPCRCPIFTRDAWWWLFSCCLAGVRCSLVMLASGFCMLLIAAVFSLPEAICTSIFGYRSESDAKLESRNGAGDNRSTTGPAGVYAEMFCWSLLVLVWFHVFEKAPDS